MKAITIEEYVVLFIGLSVIGAVVFYIYKGTVATFNDVKLMNQEFEMHGSMDGLRPNSETFEKVFTEEHFQVVLGKKNISDIGVLKTAVEIIEKDYITDLDKISVSVSKLDEAVRLAYAVFKKKKGEVIEPKLSKNT